MDDSLNPEIVLGEAIRKISNSLETLTNSHYINKKCVIDLLQVQTKLPKKTIICVLDSLEDLAKVYCEPE